MGHPFNVRVYGLLLWQDRVLVSDEWIKGALFSKFPGGGLEFGEGLKDGLIREIQEELGVKAYSLEHYYTTDFFVGSAWRKEDQMISVYYLYRVDSPGLLPTIEIAFKGVNAENDEARRWLDLSIAKPDDLTLPIDRYVLEMLLRER